jgi:hypothetical protein
MKNKAYMASGLLIAAMALTGCSDSFLDVKSPTQPDADEYFNTDAHVQEAVVAAYDPLHWSDWAQGEYNPVTLMSDIMADDLWVGGSDRTDNANWHYMMNFEAQPNYVIAGLWTDAYSGVKRCNDVLGYMEEGVEDMTEENAKYYEAQVRVLRVLYYDWLWKFWGNVVYFDKNFEGAPYLGTQYTADEVYNFMIEDLEGAIALDALPMKETDANCGRVTKAMAYMLYAEIVMYQNDESRYPTALNYMKEIIESGKYSLNSDYANIFRESGEWCDESIFEINYIDDNAIRDWSNPLAAGGTVLPTLISPNNWPAGTDGHDNGWGFCPVRQETYDHFDAADKRRDATCWNAGALGVDYNKRYQDTGLFLEKYAAHTGDNADQKASSELNWNNNLRIYRYSETLLNAAELIVRGAGSGDAAGYLQQVRERAGLQTVAANLDNIIEERRLEFVGEGKRYWDLIRTGKASTVLVPDQYGYRTNTWSESKKYLPIPQSEIDKARGTLKQNNY